MNAQLIIELMSCAKLAYEALLTRAKSDEPFVSIVTNSDDKAVFVQDTLIINVVSRFIVNQAEKLDIYSNYYSFMGQESATDMEECGAEFLFIGLLKEYLGLNEYIAECASTIEREIREFIITLVSSFDPRVDDSWKTNKELLTDLVTRIDVLFLGINETETFINEWN